ISLIRFSVVFLFLYCRLRPTPVSTLFPYTTLFRSARDAPPDHARPRREHGSAHDHRESVVRRQVHWSADWCRAERRARRLHAARSEEHTSELQSRENLVCRLLLEKKKRNKQE